MPSTRKSLLLAPNLDRTSEVPLHAQVEQRLQDLIRRAPYCTGASLPDEMTLASQLGVSRGTVRNGMLKLVGRGILERNKRAGTRVVQSEPVGWANLTGEMRSRGVPVETFRYTITRVQVPAKAALRLGVPENLDVHCLNMTEGWDGLRTVSSSTWFHPRIKLTGKEDFRESHYKLLSEVSGISADRAHEELLAVAADKSRAQLFNVPEGTPLLRRCRTSYDSGNKPIDYTEVHYHSGGVPLTLITRRGNEQVP